MFSRSEASSASSSSSLSFVAAVPKASVWQPRQPRYAFANDKIKRLACVYSLFLVATRNVGVVAFRFAAVHFGPTCVPAINILRLPLFLFYH